MSTKYIFGSKVIITDRNSSQNNQVRLTSGKGESLIVDADDFERTIDAEFIQVTNTSQEFGGVNTLSFMTPGCAAGTNALVYDGAIGGNVPLRHYRFINNTWTLQSQKSYSSVFLQKPRTMAMKGNYMVSARPGFVGIAAFFDGTDYVTNYVGTSCPLTGNFCDVWTDGHAISAEINTTTLQTIMPNGSNDYPTSTTDFTLTEGILDVSINDKFIITAHSTGVKLRNKATPTTVIKTIEATGIDRVFSNTSYIGFASPSKIYLYTNENDAQLIAEFTPGITINFVNCSQETNGLISYCSTGSIRFIKYEPTLGVYIDQGASRSISDAVDSSGPTNNWNVLSVPSDDYVCYVNLGDGTRGAINFHKLSTQEEQTTIGKIEITGDGKINIESYGEISLKSLLSSEPNVVDVEGRLEADDLKITNDIVVSGNADITGNLDVGNNLEIGGTLTYNDVPRFKAFYSGSQVITNSQKLTPFTETFDNRNAFLTDTYTVPLSGTWFIGVQGNGFISGAGTGNYELKVNGTTVEFSLQATPSGFQTYPITAILELTVGDTIDVFANTNGPNLTQNVTRFYGYFIG